MQMDHIAGVVRRPFRARRGFTLRDVTTVVVFAGVGLALLSVAMPRFRSGAMLEECIDNQREIAAGSSAFALSNDDHFAGLTWRQGNQNSSYADLRAQANQSGTAPHAAQVVDLLRRYGRLDIAPISGWFSDNQYSTIPLVDFLEKEILDPFNICPGDEHRLNWRSDPAAFDAGAFVPYQPQGGGVSPANKRWPYSSSYLFSVSAIDPFQSIFTATAPQTRMSQTGSSHGTFNLPSQNYFGPSPMSMVAHPSHKVFQFESADRHFAADPTYYALPGTTVAAAFFDSSVRVVQSQRANPTWVPNFPTSALSTQFTYQPMLWEPTGGMPAGTLPPPLGTATVTDPFRFTRDGLLGIDFPPLSRVRGARSGR